ncbi:uncharacterized protein LOC112681487 [Sipha flava]|uniref:Uncharacterized protein LOC112681487 n=2 Tax=Sipha flava TaxID=143950 RepID=A0A8B8FB10_9HEMI|nr:uncharacterized protein LOC112681487 [Sipha flava]
MEEVTEQYKRGINQRKYEEAETASNYTSSAIGTIFKGYDDEELIWDSDEISKREQEIEYDADFLESDEDDISEEEKDEAEEAQRLTRPFNLGLPKGRRCPKMEVTQNKMNEIREKIEIRNNNASRNNQLSMGRQKETSRPTAESNQHSKEVEIKK